MCLRFLRGQLVLAGMAVASAAAPASAADIVTYIAQSPAHRNEIAIATRKRHVFMSKDAGKSWRQIAREGEVL